MDIVSYIQAAKANKLVSNLQKNVGYSERFKHGEKDLIDQFNNLNERLLNIEEKGFQDIFLSSINDRVEKELIDLFEETVDLDIKNKMEIDSMDYLIKINPHEDHIPPLKGVQKETNKIVFLEQSKVDLPMDYSEFKGAIFYLAAKRYKKAILPDEIKINEEEAENVTIDEEGKIKLIDYEKEGYFITDKVLLQDQTDSFPFIDFDIFYEVGKLGKFPVKVFYKPIEDENEDDDIEDEDTKDEEENDEADESIEALSTNEKELIGENKEDEEESPSDVENILPEDPEDENEPIPEPQEPETEEPEIEEPEPKPEEEDHEKDGWSSIPSPLHSKHILKFVMSPSQYSDGVEDKTQKYYIKINPSFYGGTEDTSMEMFIDDLYVPQEEYVSFDSEFINPKNKITIQGNIGDIPLLLYVGFIKKDEGV